MSKGWIANGNNKDFAFKIGLKIANRINKTIEKEIAKNSNFKNSLLKLTEVVSSWFLI